MDDKFKEKLKEEWTFEKHQERLEESEEDNYEWIGDVIETGIDLGIKYKKRVFTRGFVMGALSAVAIQSVITILVLLG